MKASDIFTEAVLAGCDRYRNVRCLAAASLSIACRVEGYGRSLHEIAEVVCELSESEISKMQQFVASTLDLKLQPIRPEGMVTRLATRLMLKPQITEMSRQICNAIDSTEFLSPAPPQLVAAAAVLLMLAAAFPLNMSVSSTKLDLAAFVESSHVKLNALRKAFDELLPVYQSFLPKTLTQQLTKAGASILSLSEIDKELKTCGQSNNPSPKSTSSRSPVRSGTAVRSSGTFPSRLDRERRIGYGRDGRSSAGSVHSSRSNSTQPSRSASVSPVHIGADNVSSGGLNSSRRTGMRVSPIGSNNSSINVATAAKNDRNIVRPLARKAEGAIDIAAEALARDSLLKKRKLDDLGAQHG